MQSGIEGKSVMNLLETAEDQRVREALWTFPGKSLSRKDVSQKKLCV